nr:DUF1302 family protein [Dechloromonas sp. A34]
MEITGGNRPRGGLRLKRLVCSLAGAFLGVAAGGAAEAAAFDIDNPDVKISWDNTFKYSAGWRVRDINARVADNSIGPQANTNDGDQNFKKGSMISNRLDLLSEFDFRYKSAYGFRVSGAAWYDDVYRQTNDNPGALGGALVNSTSVPYNEFTDETKKLHGRKAEFRDVFAYANFAPAM